MSFFCAGSSSQSVKKKMAKSGSKPGSQPISKTSSNGHATNPFQNPKEKSLPTIPFSDQPNTRRMIVLQEYSAADNQGLSVTRGEQVQVLNEEGDWYFVRNENKKEGFVPRSHLVAPYSSTRTGRKASIPLRPVASGPTILDHDTNGAVPMYPTRSTGVPRTQEDQFMNQTNSFRRRDSSPQILNVNDTCNNNNVPRVVTNGQTVLMYDQKYSPSSSSGVASMNGPPSPSFQSYPENYLPDNMGRHSSGSSLTQERNSLSSIEENGIEMHHNGYHVPNDGHYPYDNGIRSNPTNSDPMQTRPLPHPPPVPDQEGVYLDKRMNHIYSTITSGEGPPPIPPRERPVFPTSSASQPFPESDMYIAPADAVEEQPGPHMDRPRVHSLSDVRSREGYRPVKSAVDYSEVYQGRIKAYRQNAHPHLNDSASEHSEGGSSSNRSSSRRGSGSRRQRIEHHAGPPGELVLQESRHVTHVPTQSAGTKITKFRKCLWGVYIVTARFDSQDENELSVMEGEHVSVWNQDDQEWFWIVKHSTSEEGLVPSCFLKEVVASEAQSSIGQQKSQTLPPVPLKQRSNHTQQQESQFRQRSQSQDSRSVNQTSRNRGRLNSDSSSRSRSSIKANHSVTSFEKMEIPESPPNTPPPPYSEFDQQHSQGSHPSQSSRTPHPAHQTHAPQHSHRPTRHHSLSQQHEHSVHAGGASGMHRTRSQGHVSRTNRYDNKPPSPMQRYLSPTETYDLKSPTSPDGGTLV